MKHSVVKVGVIVGLITLLLVGCGSKNEGGLKVGPTITPKPTQTPEPTYSLDMTDEEIETELQKVVERFENQSIEYDFEITEDMKAEKSEHGGGNSEIFVYDSSDNLIAVLLYTDYKIEQANIDNYENGVLQSGRVYKDGVLDSYYETSDLNGCFRVDVKVQSDGTNKYVITTGSGETKEYIK